MCADAVLRARAVQRQAGGIDNRRPARQRKAAAFDVGAYRAACVGRTFEREIERTDVCRLADVQVERRAGKVGFKGSDAAVQIAGKVSAYI